MVKCMKWLRRSVLYARLDYLRRLGRHRYVAGLAFRMSAAAHNAGVGVLARGHAITAAIPRVRPRRTGADLVRAFFSHIFQHSLWHDGMTSDVTAPRVSKRLCV